MTTISKILAPAGLAIAALAAATPAAAQVQGKIATADVSRAVISTTALQTAYNQVNTTYAPQMETRKTKQEQLANLLKPFDTNANGNLEEGELPALQKSPNFTQIQTLESEVASLNMQMNNARIYAVEQILVQYPTVLQEVATKEQVAVVLQPEAIQWAGQAADITPKITAALNTKVPSVQIVPPADYRPSQQGAQVFQEIQQYLIVAQLRQQQQAQQQPGNQQAPQGR